MHASHIVTFDTIHTANAIKLGKIIDQWVEESNGELQSQRRWALGMNINTIHLLHLQPLQLFISLKNKRASVIAQKLQFNSNSL